MLKKTSSSVKSIAAQKMHYQLQLEKQLTIVTDRNFSKDILFLELLRDAEKSL